MSDRTVTLHWNGGALKGRLRAAMKRRVRRAALEVQGRTQRNISRPFRVGGTQLRYKPKRSGTPSAPGEFPKADLGRLRQSIFSKEESALSWIVGTVLDYGAWLEEGTSRMAARPFMSRTLGEMKDKIVRILTAPIGELRDVK